MGLPDHVDVSGLSDAARAEVIDLATRLQWRERNKSEGNPSLGHGEALLDKLDANPAQQVKFDAMLERQFDAIARGEGADGETFMNELMAGLSE